MTCDGSLWWETVCELAHPTNARVAADTIRIEDPRTPSQNVGSNTGEVAWDSGYGYVCTNTSAAVRWKRALLEGYRSNTAMTGNEMGMPPACARTQ